MHVGHTCCCQRTLVESCMAVGGVMRAWAHQECTHSQRLQQSAALHERRSVDMSPSHLYLSSTKGCLSGSSRPTGRLAGRPCARASRHAHRLPPSTPRPVRPCLLPSHSTQASWQVALLPAAAHVLDASHMATEARVARLQSIRSYERCWLATCWSPLPAACGCVAPYIQSRVFLIPGRMCLKTCLSVPRYVSQSKVRHAKRVRPAGKQGILGTQ